MTSNRVAIHLSLFCNCPLIVLCCDHQEFAQTKLRKMAMLSRFARLQTGRSHGGFAVLQKCRAGRPPSGLASGLTQRCSRPSGSTLCAKPPSEPPHDSSPLSAMPRSLPSIHHLQFHDSPNICRHAVRQAVLCRHLVRCSSVVAKGCLALAGGSLRTAARRRASHRRASARGRSCLTKTRARGWGSSSRGRTCAARRRSCRRRSRPARSASSRA